jgi:hypothetical protein
MNMSTDSLKSRTATNRSKFFFVFFLTIAGAGHAMANSFTIPEQYDISAFVPPSFEVMDSVSGDLNNDGQVDVVVLLRAIGEDTMLQLEENYIKRPLLILVGKADGSFKLAARNDNAVYCRECGGAFGDPYASLSIADNTFVISHYGGSSWRWSREITFAYSSKEKGWMLVKDGGSEFNVADPEKVTESYRTAADFGKVTFEKFDIYQDQ